MAIDTNYLEIAKRDLQTSAIILGTTNDEIMQNMAAYHTQQAIEKIIKYLLVKFRGFANVEHDIQRLSDDAKGCGIAIPSWVEDNSYEISKWATTIRYNSNFKTNKDTILSLNVEIQKWIIGLELDA